MSKIHGYRQNVRFWLVKKYDWEIDKAKLWVSENRKHLEIMFAQGHSSEETAKLVNERVS